MNRFGTNILLLAILWAPFSGLISPHWSELLLYLLPLVGLLFLVLDRWNEEGWIKIPPGFNALLVFIVFVFIQLIPLPPQLVRVVSPETWQIYHETTGILQPDAWIPLTLAPKATLNFIFSLIGCLAAYIVATNYLTERDQLKKVAVLLAFLGGGLAVGILIFQSANTLIGFFADSRATNLVFTRHTVIIVTTFLLMTCLPSLALFLADRPTVRYGTLQERVKDSFSNFFSKPYLIYGLSAITIPMAIATYWAGGLLMLVAMVALFTVLLSLRERTRREIAHLLIYLFMVLIFWIFLPKNNSIIHFGNTDNAIQARIEQGVSIHQQILSDFILTGTGYGAFPAIGRRYGLELSSGSIPISPKETILQLAAQGGVIGFGAAGWFLIAFFVHTFRNWQNRRHRLAAYLYAAGVGGSITFVAIYLLTGATGLGGFPLLIFFILGLVVAASNPSVQVTQEAVPHRLLRPLTSFFALAAIVLVAFSFMGDRIGQKLFAAAGELVSETAEANESSRKYLNQASFFDPLNPRYHYLLGYRAMERNDKELRWNILPRECVSIHSMAGLFMGLDSPFLPKAIMIRLRC